MVRVTLVLAHFCFEIQNLFLFCFQCKTRFDAKNDAKSGRPLSTKRRITRIYFILDIKISFIQQVLSQKKVSKKK